jgi:bifunctional DNA-binding transcriptional regulator/antitoxin component of YhaV-PrlF toxin-antitoxin module
MSDGIVPALAFGHRLGDRTSASGDAPVNDLPAVSGPSRAPRTLDLRRTETPGLGEMPVAQRKDPSQRRYAVVMVDAYGRLTDQRLFSQLGWTPGTRVDIGVSDGHEIVVRSDNQGTSKLTKRNMVLIPASLRHWCGYAAGDPVLAVAVPSMSAVVLHSLETLDQALPDPRRLVERMRRAGAPTCLDAPTPVDATDEPDDGGPASGSGCHVGNRIQDAAGSGDGRE